MLETMCLKYKRLNQIIWKKKATKLDSVPEEILDIQVLESFEDIKAFAFVLSFEP